MKVQRLFVYGTLQPGGPNEHVLAPVKGQWLPATVNGRLIDAGWGAEMGYPGLYPDEDGESVAGFVFVSQELASLWSKLDEFEEDGYERITSTATLANRERVETQVYVLRERGK